MTDKPWMDGERLFDLYHVQRLTIREVAAELGCSYGSVRNGLKANNIQARSMGPTPPKKLKGEEWLRSRYHDDNQSVYQIAEEIGCSRSSVTRAMKKHQIERRDNGVAAAMANRAGPCYYTTTPRGYEVWQVRHSDELSTVFVHRVIMLAYHESDEVAAKDVHHKNGTPWDNRPENLQLMDHGEHSRMHNLEGGQ